MAAAQEAAHRTIEETHLIRLSVEDQRRFVDVLLNPPEPSPALLHQKSPWPPGAGVPVTGSFLIEPLGPDHDRSAFSCGTEALDRYFREQVTVDVHRRATACYVALEDPGAKIAGYYTLAAAGVPLAEMPAALPSDFPATPPFLSRGSGGWQWTMIIAGEVGSACSGTRWRRSLRSEIAVFALIVDAKDDQAEAFYLHHGFVPCGSQPRQLVLPLTKLNAKA